MSLSSFWKRRAEDSATTPARPETRVFRVEELIAYARAGRIRVPSFQRGLKWEREDVQKLIDSIWRGYPIGSLLLWSKPGPPGRVTLGEFVFDVNERPDAWFVVDGQQRVVSLVSTLIPTGGQAEKFDLYFDLEARAIVPPPRDGVRAIHLPLNRVLDAEELIAWVNDHDAALTPEQVRLALRVGKALREYELPAYVVNTADEAVVREIFQRTNSTGKALDSSDVFNALFAPLDRKPALDPNEVVEHFRIRSLGDIDEFQTLWEWLALDRKIMQGRLRGEDLPAAAERIERALDRVLGFLAQDAGIPNIRLLPDQSALSVLGPFFDRFPVPSSRARRLLTRWLWRAAATGELRGDSARRRAALEAVYSSRSDEDAARGVLSTASTRRPERKRSAPFDLRDAHSRLSVIALVELRPHDLRTEAPLDARALLESRDEAVPEIMTQRPTSVPADRVAVFSSVGNRILHPSTETESVLSILLNAGESQPSLGLVVSPHVLASHAISPEAMRALQEDDGVRFLEIRRDQIEAATARLIDRHAEWNHSDRLSIGALIEEED